MFLRLDAGSTIFDSVEDSNVDNKSPGLMMFGCEWDYETRQFVNYLDGEIDEFALWTRKIGVNSTHDEIEFYYGGYCKYI